MFGELLKTVVDVATLPVSVVVDVVTVGGMLNDKDETYTTKNIEKIGEDIDDLLD